MDANVSQAEEQRYAELQRMALDFARMGETAELEKMLQAGIPVNLADEKGNTLLMLACYNGEAGTARVLLQHGADPDRRNDRGQTPLGGVAFKGYTEIVRLLVDAGADLHADNGAGMKPVHFAAMFGRFDVVRLLEEYDASLDGPAVSADGSRSGRRLMPAFARLVGRIRSLFRSGKLST